MKQGVAAVLAALALGLLVVVTPPIAGADHGSTFIDEELDCLEPVPAAVSLQRWVVYVDLHVLRDGVTLDQARAIVGAAHDTYAPLGVGLRIKSEAAASFTGTDAGSIINQAKAITGGARPSGTDAVVVLTTKDLTSGSLGSAVAGLADCVGGVRFPEHAFAVVEARSNRTALIVAHEVGHLLGAHHHYANCTESGGGTVGVSIGFPPCTVMINDVGLARPDLSTLSGTVVRGHAEPLTP